MKYFDSKIDFDKKFNIINNIKINYIESNMLTVNTLWNGNAIASPFDRIYIITSGAGLLVSGKIKTKLIPGYAYLVPPGLKYDYSCDNSLTQIFFHVKIQFFYGIDMFEHTGKIIKIKIQDHDINKFVSSLVSTDIHDILYSKLYMDKLISLFVKHEKICFPSQKNLKYVPLFKIINTNLSAKTKLSDIAGIMHTSLQTLSRNFKKDTGIGLKQQIEQMLVSKAAELLISSDISIKEISSMLEFTDPYYFSKFIKKHTGMSPTEYRKRVSM